MSGPTARRKQLGRALRKAREEARLTQIGVAKLLGCGQAKINKIETTLVAISPAELDRLITIYEMPEEQAAELRELVSQDLADAPRRTRSSPAWSAFDELRDLEQDAREILCLHGERIPKPMQSEHYMLQQHQSDTKTAPDVVRLLRQREARSRIFTLDDPPRYRVILSESALHRMPGGQSPQLVVDQVEHLLDLMAKYERFELQILTYQADVRFVDTDFQILHFASDEPDFAYIEAPGGAHKFDRPEDLKLFAEHWYELHASALTRDDTITYLSKLAKQSKAAWQTAENSTPAGMQTMAEGL